MVAVPEMQIALDKVCFIIVKAREFDVKDAPADVDSGSNAVDDGMTDVLEDHPDDLVEDELKGFIDTLNEDEQIDLVALMWLGRDDGSIEEWEGLRAEAARQHTRKTSRYLLGSPLVGDHLEAGLAKVDLSCLGVA